MLDEAIEHVGTNISQGASEHIIVRLLEEEIISNREAKIILATMHRSSLPLNLPARDELRAIILKAILMTLKYEK